MKVALAVTGFLDEKIYRKLSASKLKDRFIDVRPEKEIDSVFMRVAVENIAETRAGASDSGYTLVQLILRENSAVETVSRMTANLSGLQEFHDPILNRVRQEATAKKIFI
jgi:hypothetical protein